jgi:hypothetical protein
MVVEFSVLIARLVSLKICQKQERKGCDPQIDISTHKNRPPVVK